MASLEQLTLKRNEPRYSTHIIISVKLSKWNPFSIVKAKLIDVSWSGFQIEFFKDVKLKNGVSIKFEIPVDKLNVEEKTIQIQGLVKWYDEIHFKAGGIYELNESEKSIQRILEKLIASIVVNKKHDENQPK